MKIRLLLVATALAVMGMVPFATPAQATHNCGFEPCPHPGDVVELLCVKFPVLMKYVPQLCAWT